MLSTRELCGHSRPSRRSSSTTAGSWCCRCIPIWSGVPHRMAWFNKILDLLLARPDTIFMNGSAIADWYASVELPPAEMKD